MEPTESGVSSRAVPRRISLIGPSPFEPQKSVLGWLLTLAFLHGLLFLLIVPPWQHYDEPTHFEYVRLIAIWNRQPALDEKDRNSSREIADSMYRFRFWQPGVQPDLISAPPWLGENEKFHPPLYYALAALPVRWFRYLSIETQLYSARIVGLCLFMLTILCTWRIMAVFMPDAPALQAGVPLLLALVPTFVDQMTSVNNDVLVNFSMTCLFLGSVLLIRDGIQPGPMLLVVCSLVVGVLTKRTAIAGLVPLVLALSWAAYPRPIPWRVWSGILLLFGVIGCASAFRYTLVTGPDGTHYVLSVRSWLANLDQNYLRLSIESTLQSLIDWERSRAAYPAVFERLFTTFWLRFGWGNVRMAPGWDLIMTAIILTCSAGLVLHVVRGDCGLALWQRRCVLLFLIAVLTAWGAAVLRVHPIPPSGQPIYIPTGRYLYHAMIPTLVLLVLGLRGLVPRRWQNQVLFVLLLFFALLDAVIWAGTLSAFYYSGSVS